MNKQLSQIEQKVNSILERNVRVEADKAWETSWTRRGIVALLTYIVIVSLMFNIKDPNPFFNALVPTFAFMLSTAVLPFAKNRWLARFHGK